MSDDAGDHPGAGTDKTPRGDAGEERYRTGGSESESGPGSVAGAPEADDRGIVTRLLDRVPKATVALGAGFLLASTLITGVIAVYGLFALVSGSYTSLTVDGSSVPAARLLLFVVLFALATVFQATGVRWARRRVKWTWVMLACAMGTVSVVASPMALPAAVLLFVSKRHFTMSTPFWVVSGDDEAESETEAEDTA